MFLIFVRIFRAASLLSSTVTMCWLSWRYHGVSSYYINLFFFAKCVKVKSDHLGKVVRYYGAPGTLGKIFSSLNPS
jgi:hypothetical protein